VVASWWSAKPCVDVVERKLRRRSTSWRGSGDNLRSSTSSSRAYAGT
jgi:hypothetical protein